MCASCADRTARSRFAPLISWAAAHHRIVLPAAVFLIYIPCWLLMPPDVEILGRGDSAAYIELAHSVIDGKGYPNFYRPPLYPFMLSGAIRLFGDNLFVFRLLNALFQAITLLLLFALTDRMLSRRCAWIFSAGYVFYPILIYQSANLLTESLFMVLVAGAIYLIFPQQPKGLAVVFAGVLSGLAMLTRANFMIVPPVLALFLLARSFGREGLKRAFLYAFFAGITVAPWTYFNYLRSGGGVIPVTTQGGYNFWLSNSIFTMDEFFVDMGRPLGGYLGIDPPETRRMTPLDRLHPNALTHPFLNEAQNDQLYYGQSFQLIRAHPGLFAKLYAVKFVNALRPWSDPRGTYGEKLLKIVVSAVSFIPLFVLGLLGMIWLWRARQPGVGLLTIPITSTYAFLVLLWPSQRFRVPLVDPYLMIFLSYAADRIWRRPRKAKLPGEVGVERS